VTEDRRRSVPKLQIPPAPKRSDSLSRLYPPSSDPGDLRAVATEHARQHERHVETFSAHHARLVEVETQAAALDDRDDRIEAQLTELKHELQLQFAVARAQLRSTLATVAAVWGIVAVIVGIAVKLLSPGH
jgi:hypothetical protein